MISTRATNPTERIALIAAICLMALYFLNLGLPAVWNPNEAFYAEAPREMLERGDLLTPYFNYEPRFQKPPLMYWLVLAPYKVMGITEAAPRIVSALCAMAGVVTTYLLALRILRGRRAALIAAALIAGALDYNTAARYGSPEMLVTVLTIAATTVFYMAYSSNAPGKKRLLYALAYAFAGLATLSKGPIGLILPLLVMGAVIVIERRWAELGYIISPAGILIYLLVSLPWYIYMIQTHGEAFTSVAFGENIGRFTSKKSGTSSIFFYFGSIPASFLPGSIFMLGAIAWIARNSRAAWERLRFPIIWTLSVFVFFSLSKSKLPTYVYSLFTPLAIITASWLDDAIESKGAQRNRMLWLSALISATMLGGAIWLERTLPGADSKGIVAIAGFSALLAYAIWGAIRNNPQQCLASALGATVALYLVFTAVLLPRIETQRHYRELAKAIETADPGGKLDLYVYGIYQENLTYYAKRRVIRTSPPLLETLLNEGSPALILIDKSTYKNLGDTGRGKHWSGKLYRYSESRFMLYLKDLHRKRLKTFVLIS